MEVNSTQEKNEVLERLAKFFNPNETEEEDGVTVFKSYVPPRSHNGPANPDGENTLFE
ncbi:MAG: hypothetical protein RL641_545 [Candidatus Parcubacteria bacterium]